MPHLAAHSETKWDLDLQQEHEFRSHPIEVENGFQHEGKLQCEDVHEEAIWQA